MRDRAARRDKFENKKLKKIITNQKLKIMKKVAILFGLVVFLTVSCNKKELELLISNLNFTPCLQTKATKSALADKVGVEFTNQGVQITHLNFEVPCDFTAVNVRHTLVNGVLNITQQGTPNLADCICYTDVSYTINGITKNEVNVIFINDVQVYCWNEADDKDDRDDCMSELFYYDYGQGFYYNFPATNPSKVSLSTHLVNDFILVGFKRPPFSWESHNRHLADVENYVNQTGLFKPIDWTISYQSAVVGMDYTYTVLWLQTKERKTCSELRETIEILEKSSLVSFANLCFKSMNYICFGDGCGDVNIMASSPIFYVRVKDANDLSDLYAIVEETNTRVAFVFNNNLVTVVAEKTSKGDALQMANYFRETGKFSGTQPLFSHTWANGHSTPSPSRKSTNVDMYITHIKPAVSNTKLSLIRTEGE
jgi:hypothetical protein